MWKKGIAVFTAFALTVSGVVFTPFKNTEAAVNSSQGTNGWNLLWSDEFDQTVGGAPDTSIWNYDQGQSGWGNYELQNYTNSTKNVYIADLSQDSNSSDGKGLAIRAQKEGNNSYTSGRIQSQNKQYMKYGRVEAKLKVENGMQSGVWPAFWMLGENYNTSSGNFNGANGTSPWPSCGEIDIMEHRNAEHDIIGTLHWNPSTTSYDHIYAGSETNGQMGYVDSMENWHTYALEWFENTMKWYVDGTCFETMDITNAQMDEFQREHFIIFNLALGSSSTPFTKNQTVSSSFTDATMYVDYVRVYQGTDSSFTLNKQSETTGPALTTQAETTDSEGFSKLPSTGNWNEFSGWRIFTQTNTSALVKDADNINGMALKINNPGGGDWNLQAMSAEMNVEAGVQYQYTAVVNSSKNGTIIRHKEENSSSAIISSTLNQGDNTISGTFTASNSGKARIETDLSNGANTSATLKFVSVSMNKVGSGSTTTTTQAQTTTQATGESTTLDWSGEAFAGDGAGGGIYTNKYKFKSADGTIKLVNIQKPGFASEAGMYVTAGSAVSTCSLGSGNYDVQGGGVILHLTAFTKKETTFTITDASGTHTCYVYYADGVSETTVAPTTTTVAPTTTTVAPTTTTTVAPTTTTTVAPTTTTTVAPVKPAAPFGLSVNSFAVGNINVVWGKGEADLYNIYIDDVKVKSLVNCGSYDFNDYSAGNHTVAVTAVINDVESDKTSSQVTVMAEPETTTIVKSDNVKVEGYQMSACFKGEDGHMGIRTVYSAEPQVNGKDVEEVGVIYGINMEGNTLTEQDMVVGSSNTYVASYTATATGKIDKQMGSSTTANYYVRTMDVNNFNADGYNALYYARSYVKLSDGTYVYSEVKNFTIYNIANEVYNSKSMSNIIGHEYVYNNILKVVNPSQEQVDYQWSDILIKPEDLI